MMTEKKFKITITVIVFSSIILNIIFYYAGFYSISADESGRTIQAYRWISGTLEEGSTWLPFYTILNGVALFFYNDLFLTPRIVIALFGLLAFISFILLTHAIFKDYEITLFASLIALFFPTRVILSSVPLTESIYFFFIFSGLVLFVKWLNKKNTNFIYYSALCFALSSFVRYEGWVFSGVFILTLIIFKRLRTENLKSSTILFLSLIVIAFPVYWFIYQAETAGNAFHFFSDVNRNYERSQGITFFSILKNNYLTRFLHHNILYFCFPGLILFGYLFLRDSRIRKIACLPLLAFIPLILVSLTGRGLPTHNTWRTSELWNILLIPFTAYFFKNINSFDYKYLKNLKSSGVKLILFVILVYYSFQIYSFKKDFYFTEEELIAGRYLRENILDNNSAKKILIEVHDWSFLHIAVASNYPDNFVKSIDGGNPDIRRNLTIADSSKIDLHELKNKNINFIMLHTPDLKAKAEKNNWIRKKKILNGWTLYEII